MVENISEKDLDEVLEEGIEVADVTRNDHILLLIVGFVPFVISTIWFVLQK